MKVFKYALTLILASRLLFPASVFSQCPEKVVITTDRDIYFSGENLWYKAGCITSGTNQPSVLSRAVYIELSNLSGTPVIQAKLYLEKGQSNSRLILPDTLSTGNYFLTGYTSWMKNYGSGVFATKMISVINPFKKDAFTSLAKLKLMSSGDDERQNTGFIAADIKNDYKTRSLVDFTLKNTLDINNITVSVARQSLVSGHTGNATIQTENSAIDAPDQSELKNPPEFLPEPEGTLVSGTIKSKSDNKPLANEIVILNFVSRTPSLNLMRTDKTGRFRFAVNQFGTKEMVIQPIWADTSGPGYMIEIDPAFSGKRSEYIPGVVSFNDSSVSDINKSIINMQVEALYNSATKMVYKTVPMRKSYSFYSDPPIKTQLDKYIELPTMSEVFKEIVPSVGVKERKNSNSLRVIGSNGIYIDYFTMVDGVQIKDVNRVVSMNPEEIKQIEVIDLKYYFKDQDLGAIISVQTKKGDLSALNFDNRIFRQEYSGYEYSYVFPVRDYSVDSIYRSEIADFRNQLFWDPEALIDKDGSHIRFYTSDATGNYVVLIEGLNKLGLKVRYEVPFTVSDK